ncbi:MAG: FeS assembly system protein [Rickettsiales bacterium]|jgi:FeS assembly SUF system protein|nr:FeS assembly system protein [Rickettsiales bacterium]
MMPAYMELVVDKELAPEVLAAIADLPLKDKVDHVLRTVYDPEIPVNIMELGLIYNCSISDDAIVSITMTLTAPACPVAGDLVEAVKKKLETIPEVKLANVELVWDPPWDRDRMSDVAKLELGMY